MQNATSGERFVTNYTNDVGERGEAYTYEATAEVHVFLRFRGIIARSCLQLHRIGFFAKQFAKMFGCLPKDYLGHSL